MDLNRKGVYFPRTRKVTSTDYFGDGDTTLRLDCLGHGGGNKAGNGGRTDLGAFGPNPSDDGCRLVLGLGPTSESIYYEAKQSKGSPSSIALQGFSNDTDSSLKLGLSGGSETLFGSGEFSVSGRCDPSVHCHLGQELLAGHGKGSSFPIVVDEGSTSAKQSAGGYMPSLLLAPRMTGSYQDSVMPSGNTSELVMKPRYCELSQLSSEPSTPSTYNVGSLGGTASDPSPTATSAGHKHHNTKKCQFLGCTKGARGASGFCIGHGGGQRCQKPGCNKGAESRTAYCKAHGGGRRCQHLGCTKSAEGKTDFCIAHGGGRRCQHSTGCTKAARGKSGLCIRHGGGKRCKVEGCTRSAEGQAGLCISHGGGRRCQFIGCTKGAQGSTLFCKAHGGGKRCIFAGCTKGAEGSTPLCKGHGGGKRCLFDGGGICPKSVHGGTDYCVAHGGGKRCAVAGCTKSARGRTDFCVRHGGGKRCKVENCGKSAQGSTDFCKAHGGGKRCSWGEGKCEKFARGRSGLCASHSNMLQDRQTNKRSMISSGLFHGLVSAASPAESGYNDNSSSGVSVVSDCTEFGERTNKRQHLLPPQVLVPLSMKSSLSHATTDMPDRETNDANRAARGSFDFVIPEGRVHGGGLMSLLGGSLKKPVNRLDQ